MIFTRNGKQILRDGEHFADCVDEAAAEIALIALEEYSDWPLFKGTNPMLITNRLGD